jgi:hypothetical protein
MKDTYLRGISKLQSIYATHIHFISKIIAQQNCAIICDADEDEHLFSAKSLRSYY